MKYEIRFTGQFKKDLKLAKKQGKDTDELFTVISLSGNYKGCRECHIEPDWLLIYEIDDGILVLMLYRVGSHSELF